MQAFMLLADQCILPQKAHMAKYKSEALAYLKAVIATTGRTATELARLVNVSASTFTRPLNETSGHKHAIKFQTLQALETATGVPLPPGVAGARRDARISWKR